MSVIPFIVFHMAFTFYRPKMEIYFLDTYTFYHLSFSIAFLIPSTILNSQSPAKSSRIFHPLHSLPRTLLSDKRTSIQGNIGMMKWLVDEINTFRDGWSTRTVTRRDSEHLREYYRRSSQGMTGLNAKGTNARDESWRFPGKLNSHSHISTSRRTGRYI